MNEQTHDRIPGISDHVLLSAVLNDVPQRIIIKDLNSVYLACNQAVARDLGLTIDNIIGKRDEDLYPAHLAARYRADDIRVMAEGLDIVFEEPYVREGKPAWLRTCKRPLRDAAGKTVGIVVSFDDITAEREVTEKLRRREWTLAALHRASGAVVQSGTEAELLQAVCEAVTLGNEYPLCWIGLCEQDAERTLRVVASAGTAKGYTDGLRVSWAPGPLGDGPAGRAVRERHPVVNNHASNDPRFIPWRARADCYGIASSLGMPLFIDGQAVGVLSIYSGTADAFGQDEVNLFQEFATTLMFGVESRRTAKANQLYLQQRAAQEAALRQALEDALGAIAGVLEQRDPYTAGHQKHVSMLAVAIGREMGLDAERLHALGLAAAVHDLGKIEVPAEILTKPARLNKAEFALIKRHPEVGYQLLSKVPFPWPIAEIARQHHEYLDGTGYPHGLKGSEILLEARILTVADIVESISSDRPYRPAMGLDEALAEIRRLSGSKLDPQVVEACVRVVENDGFKPNLMQPDRYSMGR